MSIEWIEYKGKPILYYNCQGLKGDALVESLENLFRIINETPDDMVILVNEEGTFISNQFHELSKTLTIKTREESKAKGHYKVKKAAMIGLDGIKSLLLHGYNTVTGQNVKPFKTEEEAKEWLIEE